MSARKVLMLIPGSLNDARVWQAQAAGLELIDHAAHMLPMEAPDRLTRIMRRWLDTTSP